MKFHPLLKRPTNFIPLSYEKFLFDRFNLRTSDTNESHIPQKTLINSIFGNLTTQLSINNEDSNPKIFNNQSFKNNKPINYDINNLNSNSYKEIKVISSYEKEEIPKSLSNTHTSNEKLLESDEISINNKNNIINDLSKSNDLGTDASLFRSNIKDSELNPVNYLSKLKEFKFDIECDETKVVSELDSNKDTTPESIKEYHGYNVFDGRYSHLNEYRNESVNSIVSRGVDVPERLNCLIKERGLRGLTKDCLEILSEMKRLKVPVSTETYNNCLIGCMKSKNAKLSRYLFLCLRSDILTPDLRTYTLMIKTHINAGDIQSAFSLYKKMETEGTKADLVVFSVLIDCLVENRQMNAAWEFFNYMRTWRLIEPDEVLFTIMIKGCVFSREAEKALNLYQEMLTLKKYPTIYTYTELINCLSNRKEYFHQCFQFYNNIKSQEYPVNEKIITYLLRSCCTVGNSRKARELLIESSNMKIKPTMEMYITYIKTLAKQMKLYKLSDNEKINNINKTWSIVNTILSKNNLMINQNNSSNNNNENNLEVQKELLEMQNKINNSNKFIYNNAANNIEENKIELKEQMQQQNNSSTKENESSTLLNENNLMQQNEILEMQESFNSSKERESSMNIQREISEQHELLLEMQNKNNEQQENFNSNNINNLEQHIEIQELSEQHNKNNSSMNVQKKMLEMQNKNNEQQYNNFSSKIYYFDENTSSMNMQEELSEQQQNENSSNKKILNDKQEILEQQQSFNSSNKEIESNRNNVENNLMQRNKINSSNNNSPNDTSSNDSKDITKLLNSVILVYENANYYDYAIEVLNCFQRFNAKPDYMTYFILLRMLGPKMKDPGRFFALWNQAKTEVVPQRTLLCMALDMAILSRSAKRTLEILNDMYNAKVFPTQSLMKKLYESGKKITQIHVMINNLVTLQRKITYQEKMNQNKILQTYIDEHELNKHLVPENQL